MNETICVTGGTGFVGRGVVPELLRAGFSVHAIVRKGSAGKLPQHARITIFEGNVRNAASIQEGLVGCSALVHLAGIRRHEMKRTGLTYEDVDLGSVQAAIRAMQSTGTPRIVLLSAAALGDSSYVRTKKRAEEAVVSARLDWTILRPSFILGKGQRWPIIMGPILDLLALLPGSTGDKFKRARNVTRKQLAATIIRALRDNSTIGKVVDVTGIRKFPSVQINAYQSSLESRSVA